jgi:hypothetical protein
MSILNALWVAAALWVLAVGAAGVVLGISSWTGGLTLILAAVTPILLARRLGAVPEPSLSQSIQRELR